MSIAEAVAAPRFHHQWPPAAKDRDVVRCEKEIAGLRELGYTITVSRIGDVHAVELDRVSRRAVAASDPRGIGKAASE
jgi:gamma-glutamyltranspeptidase